MVFTITDQDISIENEQEIVAGSRELYTAEFIFDETWEGYDLFVVFEAGSTRIDTPFYGDICTIPWEVLTRAARLRVGAYGITGDRIKPTVWAPWIRVNPGAYGPGNEPSDPTPTVFEQILTRFNEVSDKTYTHEQNTPSDVWRIPHGLQKYPSVSVTDSGGTQVYGEVVYLDENNVEVRWNAAFSGRADLN